MKRRYPKQKFLAPELLDEAAEQVFELATKEDIHIALLGGLAMQYYGSDRLTGDIDFVSREIIDTLPLEEPLTFGGFKTQAPNKVPVDLVIRDDEYEALYNEALDNAILIEDAPVPIVSPEYLLAMKMVAGRRRDEADVEFLLESEVVDVQKAKDIVRKHLGTYAVRDLDAIIREVEWKKRK